MKFIVILDPHLSSDPPQSRRDDYAESMFQKLDFVYDLAQANDAKDVIIAGDFSHKKCQPTPFTVQVCEKLMQFKRGGVNVYSIVGNHDVYAANTKFLDKTFLGILYASGALKHLGSPAHAGMVPSMGKQKTVLPGFPRTRGDGPLYGETGDGASYEIVGYDYRPEMVLPETVRKADAAPNHFLIGVAHGFLCKKQMYFDTPDHIDVWSFANAGFDALFVGHDHVEYPPVKYGNMVVYRPGSLSRGTKHFYNRLRVPKVLVVSVTKQDGIIAMPVDVPCKTADEIFSSERIQREDLDKRVKAFISKLSERKDLTGDVYEAIEQVCQVPEVLALVFKYLEDFGLVRSANVVVDHSA